MKRLYTMAIYDNGLDSRAIARPASVKLNVAVGSAHPMVDRSTKESVGNSRSACRCRCAPNSNGDVDRIRGYSRQSDENSRAFR